MIVGKLVEVVEGEEVGRKDDLDDGDLEGRTVGPVGKRVDPYEGGSDGTTDDGTTDGDAVGPNTVEKAVVCKALATSKTSTSCKVAR